MKDKNGKELPEIWLVERCQYCHPSGHEFDCSPVIAFKHIEDAKQFVRDAIGNQRAGIPAASWVAGEEPYGMWDYMRLSSEGRERVWRGTVISAGRLPGDPAAVPGPAAASSG